MSHLPSVTNNVLRVDNSSYFGSYFDIDVENLIVQRQKSEYVVYSKSKRNNILLKGKACATNCIVLPLLNKNMF